MTRFTVVVYGNRSRLALAGLANLGSGTKIMDWLQLRLKPLIALVVDSHETHAVTLSSH